MYVCLQPHTVQISYRCLESSGDLLGFFFIFFSFSVDIIQLFYILNIIYYFIKKFLIVIGTRRLKIPLNMYFFLLISNTSNRKGSKPSLDISKKKIFLLAKILSVK